MACEVDRNHKFSEGIFSAPVHFQCNVQAFRITWLLRWQNLTMTFTALASSSFVHYAVPFCFRCKFSIGRGSDAQETFDSGCDFSRPITILCYTWQPIEHCFDFACHHRSRQPRLFFVYDAPRAKPGLKARLSRHVEPFWNKKGFSLVDKTNRFHFAVHRIQGGITEDVKMW